MSSMHASTSGALSVLLPASTETRSSSPFAFRPQIMMIFPSTPGFLALQTSKQQRKASRRLFTRSMSGCIRSLEPASPAVIALFSTVPLGGSFGDEPDPTTFLHSAIDDGGGFLA